MKRPLAFVLGITGNLAFAAGCVAQALNRHMRTPDYDILILAGDLPGSDARLLASLPHCRVVAHRPPCCALNATALERYTPVCLAKFEIFRLLDRYRTAIWLDADIAVQDDLSGLAGYGPLGLALEDPEFTGQGPVAVAIDFVTPDPAYDMSRAHYNSGVVVARDDIPDPLGLYDWCLAYAAERGPDLRYPDQAVLNVAAQRFPGLVGEFPYARYNAHPRGPASLTAALVHGFGAYNFWDDGITSCAFPEWRRDYERWKALGGTPFQGTLENPEFLEGGAFHMLSRLFLNLRDAGEQLERLDAELRKERALRQRLEKVLLALREKRE